jgi:hypothetical protein
MKAVKFTGLKSNDPIVTVQEDPVWTKLVITASSVTRKEPLSGDLEHSQCTKQAAVTDLDYPTLGRKEDGRTQTPTQT